MTGILISYRNQNEIFDHDLILAICGSMSLWAYQDAKGLIWSMAVQLRSGKRENRSLPAMEDKPVFKPQGIGIETAEPTRQLHDDMKLANRHKKIRKAERVARSNGSGWRRFFSVSSWLRFLITFGIFGFFLHGLFMVFGVYDRNQRLPAADHFVLLIKLVVFIALMYLFYAMLMHYGPIRHKVRGIFFLALAPVAAVCIFMIYGGGQLFGSFLPVLQFLTLTIGVGGFLLYVLGYTWVAGRNVRREAERYDRIGQVRNQVSQETALDGLPPGVTGDRRKVHKAGSLRLRKDDDGSSSGSGMGGGNSSAVHSKVRLPEI
ncbi:hypothetical protein ABIE64_001265 [Thalassospira sp. MBR-102]|jgi:hypothetical protein